MFTSFFSSFLYKVNPLKLALPDLTKKKNITNYGSTEFPN